MSKELGYFEGLRALVGNHPLNLMGAAGLLLDEQGRVLLQRVAGREVWGLPGGLCELAEPPEITLRREVLEETALTVKDAELLTLLTTPLRTLPNGHQAAFYTAIYLVRDWEGTPQADGAESAEVRFFSVQELPLPLRGMAGAWMARWLRQQRD